MKKYLLMALFAAVSLGANAQFEAGTGYVSGSLTGLNFSFNNKEKVTFGVDATLGFFFEDAWMVYGQFGYDHKKHDDRFSAGAGARYYILQNGLYLNLGVKYEYANVKAIKYMHQVHNLYATPEIGYCFYLNNHVSIEPAVYYDLSLNHFSDFSNVGLRIGFGYYF